MKDSEGYLMFHIGSAYRDLRTEEERKEFLRQENMRLFLATTFQIEISKHLVDTPSVQDVSRGYPLLSHAEIEE